MTRKFYQMHTGEIYVRNVPPYLGREGVRLGEVGPFPRSVPPKMKGSPNTGTGFPAHLQSMRFDYELRKARPLTDFMGYSDYWHVSERAWEVLRSIAPHALHAAPCRARRLHYGQLVDDVARHAVDVIHFVDAVDEGRSKIQWHVPGIRYSHGTGSKSVFREDIPTTARLFRLTKCPEEIFCDEEVFGAIAGNKLSGISFEEVGPSNANN